MTKLLLAWAIINTAQILGLYLLARQKGLNKPFNGSETTIYFWDDYFFLTWNAFCSGFALYYLYFLLLEPNDLLSSSFVFAQTESNAYTTFVDWVNAIDNWNVEFAFYFAFVFLGVKAQIRSIGRQTKYWWHKSNCLKIWYVRLFCLIVNIVLVAYVSWRLAVFVLNFFAMSQYQALSVELFHIDGFGSLGAIGHAFVMSTSIFLLRALMGVVSRVAWIWRSPRLPLPIIQVKQRPRTRVYRARSFC
jgi:hypothetical protein